MLRNILFFLTITLIGSGCATDGVRMSVYEPPVVTLPSDVKKVAILDRSETDKSAKAINKIDEFMSIETRKIDKNGANACVNGLFDKLAQNNRFENIKLLDSTGITNPTVGVMPSQLDWPTVTKLCEKYQVDLLFVLEHFDSDTRVDYSTVPVQIRTPLGDVPGIEHRAKATTTLELGWRIYDPIQKTIFDVFPMRERVISVGQGINPAKAIAALTNINDLVKQTSNRLGRQYALRVLPYYPRVRREYFVAGSYSLKIGKRKAQTGNWDGAEQVWLEETSSDKRKAAGRACYNMAIISEINGDIHKALEWAQKSYEDYNIRLGLDYAKILRARLRRIKRNQTLKEREQKPDGL